MSGQVSKGNNELEDCEFALSVTERVALRDIKRRDADGARKLECDWRGSDAVHCKGCRKAARIDGRIRARVRAFGAGVRACCRRIAGPTVGRPLRLRREAATACQERQSQGPMRAHRLFEPPVYIVSCPWAPARSDLVASCLPYRSTHGDHFRIGFALGVDPGRLVQPCAARGPTPFIARRVSLLTQENGAWDALGARVTPRSDIDRLTPRERDQHRSSGCRCADPDWRPASQGNDLRTCTRRRGHRNRDSLFGAILFDGPFYEFCGLVGIDARLAQLLIDLLLAERLDALTLGPASDFFDGPP